MRILWHSHSPLLNTGYGTLTGLWVPKLVELGHEVSISAFQGLQAELSLYKGVHILNVDDQKYGSTVLAQVAQNSNVDVVVTLMDMWALPPHEVNAVGVPVVHWSPIDCAPLGKLDTDYLRRSSGRPVAPSQWGAKILSDAGFQAEHIPCALDLDVFHPDDEDREESRRTAEVEDKFVVGINAANVDRKAWPEQLAAYAKLYHAHPNDVKLLANINMSGTVNLGEVMKTLDLPTEAVACSMPGWRDAEGMASWYRTLDVLSACSHAEGLGLTPLEAQACGVPVIVTDTEPMNTETAPGGRHVACQPVWSALHHSWWVSPSIDSLYEALEDAYAAKRTGPDTAAVGYAQQFSVDRTASMWDELLKDITGED
jgi:glycosyltransferase involved in cell wall biosynthesis